MDPLLCFHACLRAAAPLRPGRPSSPTPPSHALSPRPLPLSRRHTSRRGRAAAVLLMRASPPVGDRPGPPSADDDDDREGRSDAGSRDSEFDISDAPRESVAREVAKDGAADAGGEDENELYSVIKSVPPTELMGRFAESSPSEVQQAFKMTLRNMLGSLPPMMFNMSVRTVTANLVQLMQSCLMNGYMLRNVEYRVSIQKSLESSDKLLPGTAPPSDAKIVGGTAVITNEDGSTTEVPADEYLQELRAQVTALRGELQSSKQESNDIIRFLANLQPDNLETMTTNAGEEVVDAMKRVVSAVTESQGFPEDPTAIVESASAELGQLLFWLMVVGYFLREAEVRLEMRRNLNMTSEPRGLLDGGEPGEEPEKK